MWKIVDKLIESRTQHKVGEGLREVVNTAIIIPPKSKVGEGWRVGMTFCVKGCSKSEMGE